eukprot:Hpha_TRINITY_DN15638_c5_g14::TRINITY_DN15638_c5_g14_i1::g.98371::m.98371
MNATAEQLSSSALRVEFGNKCAQWCEFDRLARLGAQRSRDTAEIRRCGAGSDLERHAHREHWRGEREVQAMGAVVQQDSRVKAAEMPTIGAGPAGQLNAAAASRCAELIALEAEEQGVIHSLTSDSLRANPFRSGHEAISRQAPIWRPTADPKSESALRATESTRAGIVARRSSRSSTDPFDSLREVGQLVILCEGALKEKRVGVEVADPLLAVCVRIRAQREEWIDAVEKATAAGASLPHRMLQRARKSLVTLEKVEKFRCGQHAARPRGGTVGLPPVTPTPATPTPSQLANSVQPSPPEPPLAAAPSLPLRAATPLQDGTEGQGRRRSSGARKGKSVARTPAQRAKAARRLQQWWRWVLYWLRAQRAWGRIGLGVAYEWRQRLDAAAAAGRASKDRRSAAAVQVQRVWRGYLWGLLLLLRRRRAAIFCQRRVRGRLARTFLIPAVRQAAALRRKRAVRVSTLARQKEDVGSAPQRKEYMLWHVNLRGEAARIDRVLREEEARFKREWRQWEDRLTQHCLNEIPLDSEWMEQPRNEPTAPRTWLHLKTRRTSTEHPNLRLVEVHRKRQVISTGRVRDQQRHELKQKSAALTATIASRG